MHSVDIVIIAHNIRSIHNIGSIFRTSEGFGVTKIYLTGYSPYPKVIGDTRLPHIYEKMTAAIHKTALGAETMISYDHHEEVKNVLKDLKQQGYVIVGLEQDERSTTLRSYQPAQKIALLLGEEVAGLTDELRNACEVLLEIPMTGQKESFNVSVATGIALYALTSATT